MSTVTKGTTSAGAPYRVVVVPCLKDNYAYLVVCETTGEAAVVDPSEAAPVMEAALREGVTLNAVWCTHHHGDHVGGNETLAREFAVTVTAHGSDEGRLPGQTHRVGDGDGVTVGRVEATVLHVPGHTLGAVAYWIDGPGGAGAVFTGDTLFLGGCGRLFEGTPAMMHGSLSKLAQLPPATRVFVGHEYTETNLRFALELEPQSDAVSSAHREAAFRRSRGEPTVPGTLSEELATNPFLRTSESAIRERFAFDGAASASEVFAAVRSAKDRFAR